MNSELQILNRFGLTPGDSLTIPKSGLQIIQHHALYLGYDEYGQHWMCENAIGYGVRLTRVEDFFKDVVQITNLKKFSGSNSDRMLIIQKALSRLGQPYNLIKYNCEHFVNDVLINQVKSNQIESAFKVLGGLTLAFVLIALISES